MKILIWLGTFFFRLYYRIKPKEAKSIVGIPYQRDPDNVCEAYEPFLLNRAKQYFQDCETDGHYLCKKCCHRKIESPNEFV
jgi:hypothetical protein